MAKFERHVFVCTNCPRAGQRAALLHYRRQGRAPRRLSRTPSKAAGLYPPRPRQQVRMPRAVRAWPHRRRLPRSRMVRRGQGRRRPRDRQRAPHRRPSRRAPPHCRRLPQRRRLPAPACSRYPRIAPRLTPPVPPTHLCYISNEINDFFTGLCWISCPPYGQTPDRREGDPH